MAASSCGTSPVGPCSGQDGIPRAPPVWPLRLMAAGSPAGDMRPPSGSGVAGSALKGHSAMVNGLAFTPDSRSLLSGSDDGTLRLWDVERGESLRVMEGYTASLYDIAWSPDGTQLVSSGMDTLVTIWEVAGGTPPRVLRGHPWNMDGVACSPEWSRLARSEVGN